MIHPPCTHSRQDQADAPLFPLAADGSLPLLQWVKAHAFLGMARADHSELLKLAIMSLDTDVVWD